MKHKQTCTLSDDWTYKGMKVIFLENEFLRIGILADRGSDIFEFKYKPFDLDFLLWLPKGVTNPAYDFSQCETRPTSLKTIIMEDGRTSYRTAQRSITAARCSGCMVR